MMFETVLGAIITTLTVFGIDLFVKRRTRIWQLFTGKNRRKLVLSMGIVGLINFIFALQRLNLLLVLPLYLVCIIVSAVYKASKTRMIYLYVSFAGLWLLTQLVMFAFYVFLFGEGIIYSNSAVDVIRFWIPIPLLVMMGLVSYVVYLIFDYFIDYRESARGQIRILFIYNVFFFFLEGLQFYYLKDTGGTPLFNFLCTAFLVVDYLVLVMASFQEKKMEEEQRNSAGSRSRYEYYMKMEQEHLQIRKLYHEMKNQMMYYDSEAGSAMADKLSTGEVADRLKQLDSFYVTGSETLDIILHESREKARERGITFDASIEKNCLNFMRDQDINTIFINAVQNAIEACEKMTGGDRKITVRAGQNLNDVMVYFRNTVQQDAHSDRLATQKEEKLVHGLGLMNINQAAQKYQGYMSIQRKPETFQLTILFVDIAAKEEEAHA